MADPRVCAAHCDHGRAQGVSDAATFDHVALVTGPLGHGGIETLVLRLSRALVDAGKRVHLFCSGGELQANLPDAIEVRNYFGWSEFEAQFRAVDAAVGTAPLLSVSLDPNSAAMTGWMMACSGRPGADRHINGVFHPEAYFLAGEDRLRFAINRLVLASLDDDQIFFMNEESRASHARWARRSFARSPLLPLAIDAVTAGYAPRAEGAFRVVSVGRLVPFKDYNLEIPRIVSELRERGIAIEWHIFGSGVLEPEIRRRVEQYGVEKDVILGGDLPYARLAEELTNHDAFVGMGTAALEAAMLGLPSILAVVSAGERSYGSVQDVPFGNVGEMQAHAPPTTIGRLLSDLYAMDQPQRIAVGRQSRAAALAYATSDYVGALLRIGNTSSPPRRARAWLTGATYRAATVGRSRRIASAIVRRARSVLRPAGR